MDGLIVYSYNLLLMIKTKTVLVLGAGASYPYGLPLAKELRKQICFEFAPYFEKLLEGRERNEWRRKEQREHLQEFTKAFFKSSDRSIDVWLVKNPIFTQIGKQAISSMILNGEHKGDLREKAPHHDQDWYSYLWQRMTDEFTQPDDYKHFSENEVDFITFNYDRSLDQFLYESLTYAFYDVYSNTYKEIIEQLNKRRLIHVYGQIGPLEWQGSPNLPYGKDPNSVWPRFASHLKIIYEAEHTSEVEEARKLIQKAQRIFFLGFGFAKENLEILQIPNILESQKIYGTAFGLTSIEIAKISAPLKKQSYKPIIKPLNCLQLLREYL